jgi:hypothetical protein
MGLSSNLDLKCPANEKKKDVTNKNKVNVCSLKSTNTDWASQVALIRKNHNMIEKRRNKNVKRLETV